MLLTVKRDLLCAGSALAVPSKNADAETVLRRQTNSQAVSVAKRTLAFVPEQPVAAGGVGVGVVASVPAYRFDQRRKQKGDEAPTCKEMRMGDLRPSS